ncbi:MAG: penicillin-binding transpeptidase domain-containing protein [Ktedonobacterales bacterium]
MSNSMPPDDPAPWSDSDPADAETPPEERTVRMPPEYQPQRLPPLPRLPASGPGGSGRRRGVIALSTVLIAAVVLGSLAYALHGRGAATGGTPTACASATACGVANAYLLAYTGFHFEQMYTYTSAASRQQFSDPRILRNDYKDAHDYIVNRTADILAEAEITGISATPGKVVSGGAATATVPVHISLESTRVGSFTQDITVPLVLEAGQWRVNWTPGLIFPQLDSPANDPLYTLHVHLFPQNAARGTIFDRDGNVLAKDDTVYQIDVTPAQVKDENTMVSVLSKNLDMTAAEVKANYNDAKPTVTFLIRTITTQAYSAIQAALAALPGVSAQQATGRVYPYDATAAAVTGYVGDVTPDDLSHDSSHYYEASDQIGRAGVEAWGERYLRPTKGGKLALASLNADGFSYSPVATIAERAAVPGEDLHTTVQLKSQQTAMAQLQAHVASGAHAGGAFAVDPATGAVLVMASYPIYDPNLLSLGITTEEYQHYQSSGAFLNRAVQDPRATGSVFKIVDLAAALENGLKTDTFTCHGTYQVPGETTVRKDSAAQGHGTLTAADALPPSCDVIYWQVAIKLNGMDPNLLPKMARAMGLGVSPAIVGLPATDQDPGLVPDPAYEQSHGKQWNASFAADLGVGQGDFQATPAQIALMTAAVGDAGHRMEPRLVSQVTGTDGAVLQTFAPTALGTLPISSDNLAVVQASMLGVVESPNGTTYRPFLGFPVQVAGKTGTAQAGDTVQPHAWFTCFAPASPLSGPPVPPQIAAAFELQNAGYADANVAPVSRAVLATFFGVK